jgi:ECF sigma factor
VEITGVLQQPKQGDGEALNLIIPLIYEELKRLAGSHLRRERSPASLQTNGPVHEAFLKLAGSHHPSYENRSHFFGIASRAMGHVWWMPLAQGQPRNAAPRARFHSEICSIGARP